MFVRLLILMLLATAVPFLVSNIISYRSTSASIQDSHIQLNQNSMNIGMENIKNYFKELNQLPLTWYADADLMEYLRQDKSNIAKDMYLDRQIAAIYSLRPEINFVHLYGGITDQQYYQIHYSLFNAPWRDSIPTNRREDWMAVPNYEVKWIGSDRFLAMHKKLIDYPKSTMLGLLSIYVSLTEIERLNKQIYNAEQESEFMFVGENKQLLYTSTERGSSKLSLADIDPHMGSLQDKQGYWFGEWQGNKGVFIYVNDTFIHSPLTLIKFIPADLINQTAQQTLKKSLAIQFAALAAIIVFVSVLSYSAFVPIKRLIRNMARVETGNFGLESFKTRDDEIGILETRFALMVRNLEEYVIRDYKQRIELSTAQLKMLQAQINPHFLYNALQSINTLALRNRMDNISDKITELGAILRYSMDLSTEVVPLKQEIEHIEHYLSLQEGRFRNKLSFRITSEPLALQIPVPKMILQPLVENSIIHGFEKGTGSGEIEVNVTVHDRVVISIVDNGKGMDQATVEQIKRIYANNRPEPREEGGGIGMINVLQRLRIKYDERFEWDISSLPYNKTEIRLSIPLAEEDNQ
ncbi:sensor histidine kinase [Paenibacillus sp. N3.4]|uniref:sensor histidine kinase n=1 Tax=Paenibacillus sp. N3.4 TaxID=2603222 RepID=UPI00164F5133|nr:histidine kinase [Paenibacillus sp. N3.4]